MAQARISMRSPSPATAAPGANAGLHLYRVDDTANNMVPPFAFGTGYELDPKRYWGVFVANGTSQTYGLVYDFTRHQGISQDDWNSLKLASREGNCDKPWMIRRPPFHHLPTPPRTLTKTGLTGTEFILAGNINAQDPLVVRLLLFKAVESQAKNVITVQWETATEKDTLGFHLWRGESRDGVYTRLTDDLTAAKGGDTWGAAYIYDDFDVSADKTYWYKLEEIEDNETHNFYGPVSSDGRIVIDNDDCDDDDDDCTVNCFISVIAGR